MSGSLYETGVRDAFDKYIIAKSQEKRDYEKYWSASSAGYCMRKVIYDKLGVPEIKSDPRKYRIFEVGHIFHQFMQGITKDAGLSVAQEEELIDDKIMVKGHFDDLIKCKDELILYDYKSTSSQSFKYKNETPSNSHKMQVGTYLYMLRKQYPKLKEGRLLLISKDDLRQKEQQVIFTPALEKEIYGYWSTLNGYWKNKQLPKCTCADNDGGFMAKEAYNPYYYEGEPCSLAWAKKTKEEGLWDFPK